MLHSEQINEMDYEPNQTERVEMLLSSMVRELDELRKMSCGKAAESVASNAVALAQINALCGLIAMNLVLRGK
jgi:hypothetical protein